MMNNVIMAAQSGVFIFESIKTMRTSCYHLGHIVHFESFNILKGRHLK